MIKQAYEDLTKINLLDFRKKSVLIIGAGYIANQYAIALSNLKIKDVTILGKTKKNGKHQENNSKILRKQKNGVGPPFGASPAVFFFLFFFQDFSFLRPLYFLKFPRFSYIF